MLWHSGISPLTLQPEQLGGVGSIPGRTQPLEHHDNGSRTRLGLPFLRSKNAPSPSMVLAL